MKRQARSCTKRTARTRKARNIPSHFKPAAAGVPETENSIRRHEGRALLAAAQKIASLDETIDYADAITRVALPYGVAAQFFQEAMDNFQAENYRAKYVSALNDARKLSFEPIVDVYGGY